MTLETQQTRAVCDGEKKPVRRRPPNALERLEDRMDRARKTLRPTRVSGVVSGVSSSHYEVTGLSRFLKLGEFVEIETEGRLQMGEVVRIDSSSSMLKPFDSHCEAGIARTASLCGRMISGKDASSTRSARQSTAGVP